MTITVTSNEKPAAVAAPPSAPVVEESKVDATPVEKAGEEGESKDDATLSAPEGETSEQNESSDSETEETTETKEGQTTEPEHAKKKGGFQRRIDKLNGKISAKEQEVEFWKQQALKGAGANQNNANTVAPPEKPSQEGKPKPESFDTHTEYVEALTDWKTEQKWKDHEAKQAKVQADQEQSKVVSTYADRVKAFAKDIPDFAEALSDVDSTQISTTMRDVILTSEFGPQIAYQLAKDPDELQRLIKLGPIACARELGKIESRFSSSSKSPVEATKKTTTAPKPIDPIGTGGKGSVKKTIADPTLSQKEYEAIRQEQIKKRRQAG